MPTTTKLNDYAFASLCHDVAAYGTWNGPELLLPDHLQREYNALSDTQKNDAYWYACGYARRVSHEKNRPTHFAPAHAVRAAQSQVLKQFAVITGCVVGSVIVWIAFLYFLGGR